MKLLLLLLLCFVWLAKGQESRLLLVHAIWSQASHSPYKPLPSYNNETWWPQGLSAINRQGMAEAYRLGELLKERYYSGGFQLFKGDRFDQFYTSSSDRNLSLQTAYATLAGMMPNMDAISKKWPHGWRPVPVHSKQSEILTNSRIKCPAAEEAMKERMFSAPWFLNGGNLQFLYNVIERSGYSELENLLQLYELWDSVNSMKQSKIKWPSWMEEGTFRTLKSLIDAGAALSFNDRTVSRLKGGPLLNDIIKRIEAKMKCLETGETENCRWLNGLKFYAYSADDFVLHALMATLGAAHARLPGPSSVLLIELWKNIRGDFETKVVYRKSNKNRFRDIPVSGCLDLVCSLDDFIKRSKKSLPENWNKECGMIEKENDLIPETNKIEIDPISEVISNEGSEPLKLKQFTRSCNAEIDRSDPKDCYDWAVFNYCEQDVAVKYLFCRQTCLCDLRFAKRKHTVT